MLGRQGRTPTAPFRIALEDGTELRIERLLRILPGKRIVGEGNWKGRRVLAKLFISTDSAQHAARETHCCFPAVCMREVTRYSANF